MDDKQREEFLRLVEKWSGTLTIVEGPSDRAALVRFGFANVRVLHQKALFEVIESIPDKTEVVILTDLDQEGRKLYRNIARELYKKGCTIQNELRNFLFTTRIRQIEGLHQFADQ
jgi:5S rRNA maturation endonuclease (ribonuclease M5)